MILTSTMKLHGLGFVVYGCKSSSSWLLAVIYMTVNVHSPMNELIW